MEALGFLSQGDAVRMGWRLVAIHGSMRVFGDIRVPKSWGMDRKLRASGWNWGKKGLL